MQAGLLFLSGAQKIVKKRLDIETKVNIIQVCLGPCCGANRRPKSLNVQSGTGMVCQQR